MRLYLTWFLICRDLVCTFVIVFVCVFVVLFSWVCGICVFVVAG